MRNLRKWTRILGWTITGGIVMQVGCSESLGKFIGPVVQPIIGQVLSQISTSLTTSFLQITQSILNQILGLPPTTTGS